MSTSASPTTGHARMRHGSGSLSLTALSDTNADIHIFEQMPLIMRIQALKGETLYAPDPDLLYAVAYTTIRDYEAFRHRLQDYTGEKAIT